MATVNDPSGTYAGVTPDNHLMVESIAKTDLEYNSLNLSRGFSVKTRYAATANDYILTIENTSETLKYVIDEVNFGSSAAAEFEFGFVTAGTPAGTSVAPVNLNGGGINGTALNCFGGEAVTGITSTDIIVYEGVGTANQYRKHDTLSGVILNKGDIFYIRTLDTATTTATVYGHFRDV